MVWLSRLALVTYLWSLALLATEPVARVPTGRLSCLTASDSGSSLPEVEPATNATPPEPKELPSTAVPSALPSPSPVHLQTAKPSGDLSPSSTAEPSLIAEQPNRPPNAVNLSDFIRQRRMLTQTLVKGRIRIFFDIEGKHAIDPTDANRNSLPDQVEDILLQTWVALNLWKSLAFPDPFTAERYREVAWLDIHLLHRSLLGSNGVTYDEIQSFHRPGDPEGTPSLCFDVATQVHAHRNFTPAHEVFHLIQNSATYFKNRWYTEGTARWSERGLGVGGNALASTSSVWPPADEQLAALFLTTYEAADRYWRPLLAETDPHGWLPAEAVPAEIRSARYVNGESVLKDFELTGWKFIRDVLEALAVADDEAFASRGLSRWTEDEQRSTANDRIIHRTIADCFRRWQP
jgi:hypothetical protein